MNAPLVQSNVYITCPGPLGFFWCQCFVVGCGLRCISGICQGVYGLHPFHHPITLSAIALKQFLQDRCTGTQERNTNRSRELRHIRFRQRQKSQGGKKNEQVKKGLVCKNTPGNFCPIMSYPSYLIPFYHLSISPWFTATSPQRFTRNSHKMFTKLLQSKLQPQFS